MRSPATTGLVVRKSSRIKTIRVRVSKGAEVRKALKLKSSKSYKIHKLLATAG